MSISAIGVIDGKVLRCGSLPVQPLPKRTRRNLTLSPASLGQGLNDNTLDRIPEIKGEPLVVFGRQDPHIPREGRATIYNALADAGTNFSWHEFNGAHAFMRDEGARYDAAAARTVYAMALDLFRRKLSEGDLLQIQGSARLQSL